jgi:hypothetical protein
MPIHDSFEGGDLEVVFDVYSQSVPHAAPRRGKLLKNPFWTALLPDFEELM